MDCFLTTFGADYIQSIGVPKELLLKQKLHYIIIS